MTKDILVILHLFCPRAFSHLDNCYVEGHLGHLTNDILEGVLVILEKDVPRGILVIFGKSCALGHFGHLDTEVIKCSKS